MAVLSRPQLRGDEALFADTPLLRIPSTPPRSFIYATVSMGLIFMPALVMFEPGEMLRLPIPERWAKLDRSTR